MCLLPSCYECLTVPSALQMSHYVVVSNMSYSMFVIGMRHLMKPSVWFSSHSLFQDSMHSDLVSYLHCVSGYRQLETWFQIPSVNINDASLGQFNGLEHCGRDWSGRGQIWNQISFHGDRLIKPVSMHCEALIWHFCLHPKRFAYNDFSVMKSLN